MPINWLLTGAIFFSMWFLLWLLFRAIIKHSQKLKEEKHKSQPLIKMRVLK